MALTLACTHRHGLDLEQEVNDLYVDTVLGHCVRLVTLHVALGVLLRVVVRGATWRRRRRLML